MPIYEYVCEKTGDVIELIRPMAEADKPVPDPEGRGRVFKRTQSVVAAPASTGGAPGPAPGGCCPCGKNRGGCSSS